MSGIPKSHCGSSPPACSNKDLAELMSHLDFCYQKWDPATPTFISWFSVNTHSYTFLMWIIMTSVTKSVCSFRRGFHKALLDILKPNTNPLMSLNRNHLKSWETPKLLQVLHLGFATQAGNQGKIKIYSVLQTGLSAVSVLQAPPEKWIFCAHFGCL